VTSDVTTPVSAQYDLAVQALRAGKHVFVEKPLGGSTEEASDLTETASEQRLLPMPAKRSCTARP
jgi:predicted dehydrogenase